MSEWAIIGRAGRDITRLESFLIVVSDCRFARHDMFYHLRRALSEAITNDCSYTNKRQPNNRGTLNENCVILGL